MDVIRQQPNQGWIEVIVGSMFSGKSEELIRRLRRAQIARQRVQIFKPALDTRYADDAIVSHSEMRIPSRAATACCSARRVPTRLDAARVSIPIWSVLWQRNPEPPDPASRIPGRGHEPPMSLQLLLQRVLFLFGIGFLIANLLVIADLIRFRLRKPS